MSIKPLQAKISKIDDLLDRLEIEIQKVPADNTSSEVSNIRYQNRYTKNHMVETMAQAAKRSTKKSVKTTQKTY